jgi:hypothetical protein
MISQTYFATACGVSSTQRRERVDPQGRRDRQDYRELLIRFNGKCVETT